MVGIRHLIIALLIVIAGIWVAFRLFESEERKVKKQFALLSEWVSKDSNETPFTLAQRVKKIGTLFNDNCLIKTPFDSFSGKYTPEEISGVAARSRVYFSTLDLKFYDLGISFPEKRMADVSLTARLTGKSKAGEYMDETRELRCVLRKTEKGWLFSELEVIEVLKK
jgi:hypothetical protein